MYNAETEFPKYNMLASRSRHWLKFRKVQKFARCTSLLVFALTQLGNLVFGRSTALPRFNYRRFEARSSQYLKFVLWTLWRTCWRRKVYSNFSLR